MSFEDMKQKGASGRRTLAVVLAIGASLAAPVGAQTPGPAPAGETPTVIKPTDPLEYGGIVNGQTLTNIGNYFHANTNLALDEAKADFIERVTKYI